MFDKTKFAKTLKDINDTYDTMTEFAKKADFDRTYISKYINMKLDNPPTPKILQKLASASNGITNYEELMIVCGYLEKDMELTEIFKKIFYKYYPLLEKLNLSNDLTDIIYKMAVDSPDKYEEQFDILLSKLPQKTQDDVLKIHTKILAETGNLLESTIDSIKIRTKYNLEDNIINRFYMTPVYGRISAGQPNWAEECIEGRIPIDPVLFDIINPEEHFFLRVYGESMNKVIRNGAYALIHKQDIVENGEIAVVLVNGDEATLKKFNKQGDLIILEPMSDDSSFQVQVYNKSTPIKILGKYVGKFEISK